MAQDNFDVIIIGSGMGALSAASILAQMNKKRVLVIERHFEIGGFTHSFRRKGFSWDVGLHYVGDMFEGAMIRGLADYVTGGRLKWEKMPENFEKFIYPDFIFDVPSNPDSYRERLIAAFPHERAAIERYFKDIRAASSWQVREFMTRFLPGPIAWPIRIANRTANNPGRLTTAEYLRSHVADEKLRALLTSQWGDYGLTAEQSSFAVHALIVSHYLNGGYYPHGGAERIARIVEEIVESYGGAFLTSSEVSEILIRDDRVEGVRVRHIPQKTTVDYHSKTVISGIGAVATYSRFLAAGAKQSVLKNTLELTALDNGLSAVILFLGLNASPQSLGVRGENWWINETADTPEVRVQTERLLRGLPTSAYLSFPSMKAGDGRPPTAEIIALVVPEYFDAWRGQPWRKRAPEYYALKEKIADGLLGLIERHLPGFGALVDYRELATPLTIEHFSGRAHGRMYGVPDVPEKFKSKTLRVKTPVHGLYLTGSDVCSLGIGGALMGGIGTASLLNGSSGFFRISRAAAGAVKKSARQRTKDGSGQRGPFMTGRRRPLPNQKLPAVLIDKLPVSETVFEVVFELPLELSFEPGQYARVSVGNYEWRDYSIVELCGKQVTFLIDTRFNGHGSKFVTALAPGDETFMRIPAGDFTIAAPEHAHVFIATGTGISPFIPMIGDLARHRSPPPIELFFGCRFRRDAALTQRIKERCPSQAVDITVCVSREMPSEGMMQGRVTEVIRGRHFDPAATDFYICGNPSMIDDTMKILLEKDLRNIYREHY